MAVSAARHRRPGLASSREQPDRKPQLVLLLDEPTASLDPDTGDWVRTYLEEYRAETGATTLLASHNMGEVERLCDQVLMMRAGAIVDRGTPADLLAKYGRRTMEEVFLDIAREGATGARGATKGEAA
jgi:ABC-2 type transport system ATP-binding protein